jgi:tetratricopeptide (TPR) repeat protein
LQRALSLADDGDWVSAAELLREQLGDFGDEASLHCALGVAERELGNAGLAYECFKKALQLQPEDPYVLATAGNGVALFDDPDAMEALKSAALLAPDLPLTRMLYGAYLAREGFHDWAVEQLEAARELDPTDSQIAYELGVAFALSGQVGPSARSLAEAVRLDPRDGWTRVLYGLVLLEDDRLDEAAGELLEGARLRPEDVEAQLLAALAACATGLDGVSYEMLERARMRALELDLELVDSAAEHVEAGPEAAATLLSDDVQPEALRVRLRERP